MKGYQRNYLELLRTYHIPWKLHDYRHKGKGEVVDHRKDGGINSPNLKIGTGQEA
jgi:hypothetical protein